MHPASWSKPPLIRLSILVTASLAGFLTGCSTPPLQTARANFQAGRFAQANANLESIPKGDKDEILYLMERGMIRQNLAQYDASNQDWRQAADLDAKLETYSIAQGASSLIVNDRTLSFRGMPFERVLLYAFLAKNYLAQYNWDYAAICARNIIKRMENRDGFPDIAYGRYLAGFCLELINDEGNAAIQYAAAGQLLTNMLIDAVSGDFAPRDQNSTKPTNNIGATSSAELVIFIAMGQMPTGETEGQSAMLTAPYAEIYSDDAYLGRSYPFSNTADLMADSRRRLAAIQLAKDATRIATKIAISEAAKQQNDALGALVWLTLFAMEMPDTRCWETLPLWLHIARVPCPEKLPNYKVVFKSAGGSTLGTKTIAAPLTRRGNMWISFCRDIGD